VSQIGSIVEEQLLACAPTHAPIWPHVVCAFWQACAPVQLMSHAHESLQSSVPWHDLGPMHITSHAPLPHSMFSHDCWPLHEMSHDFAIVQSMPLRHDWLMPHAIVHAYPAGHCTTAASQFVVVQSMLHV
jgi:hypothetical protein